MEPVATNPNDAPAAGESPRWLCRSLRFWIPAVLCVLSIVAVPIAFIVGAVVGNIQIYHNFSEHQQARIEVYLSQYPEAFSGISVNHASDGWAYPIGSVTSQNAYDKLDARLHEMFGDELAKRMINTVEVDSSS